jgi:hypothetical protein
MPCLSGDDGPSAEELRDRAIPKAVLCAFMRAMPVRELQAVFLRIDWKEAGVTEDEFMGWWRKHQRQDATRRAYETEQQRKKQLTLQALRKLDPDEREAITGFRNIPSDLKR